MSALESIVAKAMLTFSIPREKCHLGHVVIQGMKNNAETVQQIDGGTGEIETNASVLSRSTRLARCLWRRGVRPGDVIALMAPNCLDLAIPFYACLYNGYAMAAIDYTFKVEELKIALSRAQAKIIFCQKESINKTREATSQLEIPPTIVAFDDDDENSFQKLLSEVPETENIVEDFIPAEFDQEKTPVWLLSTSGTTGIPKLAVYTFKNLLFHLNNWCRSFVTSASNRKINMVVSPLQWFSCTSTYLYTATLGVTRLQTSHKSTPDHVASLINIYKPTIGGWSPPKFYELLTFDGKCDWSCFEMIGIGGSAVFEDLVALAKKKTNAIIMSFYGMTETYGSLFIPSRDSPASLCGKPLPIYQYKLVDPDTDKEIEGSNIAGELWVKSDWFVKEYYADPEETKKAFTDDGWFKTGDILKRDEENNYYFVDRKKFLLKYKNYQISPLEIEDVIRRHKGVLNVAVTGVSHPSCGELPVACVIKKSENSVNAQEIKDLVKEHLSEWKQLRGGVIFLDKIPLTAAGKIASQEIKRLALNLTRELAEL